MIVAIILWDQNVQISQLQQLKGIITDNMYDYFFFWIMFFSSKIGTVLAWLQKPAQRVGWYTAMWPFLVHRAPGLAGQREKTMPQNWETGLTSVRDIRISASSLNFGQPQHALLNALKEPLNAKRRWKKNSNSCMFTYKTEYYSFHLIQSL